ncbi:hypothetical protein [Mycobacterium sp. SMC-11]|uniref:hypothetical protein n=1 Tax=Mycobacterium sp. SMC-11 TaxID=3385969 RepID=UPI00390C80FC
MGSTVTQLCQVCPSTQEGWLTVLNALIRFYQLDHRRQQPRLKSSVPAYGYGNVVAYPRALIAHGVVNDECLVSQDQAGRSRPQLGHVKLDIAALEAAAEGR